MRIARGRLDLVVTEQLADHRQALTERQRPGSEAVPQVVKPHIGEVRLRPHPVPVMIEIGKVFAGLRARNDPRVARDAGQFRQHPRRRRRQRHQPRTGLRVRELQLARFKIDMLPFERDDLVAPAPGQHQQTDRRRRVDRQPSPGLHIGQHRPQMAELRLGQKPLALRLLILAHVPARVAPAAQLPLLREVEQAGPDLQRPVRLVGNVVQIAVQLVDVLALHVLDRHAAVGRHDETLDRPAVRLPRALLAAHVDMLRQIARGELRHRHRAPVHRVLAAPHAVEGPGRLLARLIGGDDPVTPERHPARLPLVPGLDDIHLRPGRIDPDPEARNTVIPEDLIAVLDDKRIDRALGDGAKLQLGHAMPLLENGSHRPRSAADLLFVVSVRWT